MRAAPRGHVQLEPAVLLPLKPWGASRHQLRSLSAPRHRKITSHPARQLVGTVYKGMSFKHSRN